MGEPERHIEQPPIFFSSATVRNAKRVIAELHPRAKRASGRSSIAKEMW